MEGVIREINEMQKAFSSCGFIHEFRTSNCEPHKLTRIIVGLLWGKHVWLDIPHDTNVMPVTLSLFNKYNCTLLKNDRMDTLTLINCVVPCLKKKHMLYLPTKSVCV